MSSALLKRPGLTAEISSLLFADKGGLWPMSDDLTQVEQALIRFWRSLNHVQQQEVLRRLQCEEYQSMHRLGFVKEIRWDDDPDAPWRR